MAPSTGVLLLVLAVVLRLLLVVLHTPLTPVLRLKPDRQQLGTPAFGLVALDPVQVLLVLLPLVAAVSGRLQVDLQRVPPRPPQLCTAKHREGPLSSVMRLRPLNKCVLSQLQQLRKDDCEFVTGVGPLLVGAWLPIVLLTVVLLGAVPLQPCMPVLLGLVVVLAAGLLVTVPVFLVVNVDDLQQPSGPLLTTTRLKQLESPALWFPRPLLPQRLQCRARVAVDSPLYLALLDRLPDGISLAVVLLPHPPLYRP